MSLLIAPVGQELKIARIAGDDKVRKHLESLGIVKDETIALLSHEKNGAIVRIKDSRLAIDDSVLSSIIVIS